MDRVNNEVKFYNIVFKIEHKIYTASGSAPPKEKFRLRLYASVFVQPPSIVYRGMVITFRKLA
jgi:hypothetical protein